MNLIEKRVNFLLGEKRLQKNRPLLLKDTLKFSKKNDIKILCSRLDFLTLKIQKNLFIIQKIENFLTIIYDHDDIRNINNLDLLHNKLILFDKYYIFFTWYAFWEQKKVYWIYDKDKNKIWQIILINENIKKKNKNVINTLEFKWLFFKCYIDDIFKFYDFFSISVYANWIVKRLDYCIDIQGIEVFQLDEYIKSIHKNRKNVNALTWTDKKKLLESDLFEKIKNKIINKKRLTTSDYNYIINTNIDFEYWKQKTYIDFKSSHNDLKIYDKILDLLDNHLKRRVDWVNPYQDYLDSSLPITRIEVKKKKFQNLTNNSIDWLTKNIEPLFFDHLLRYFKIDLSLYLGLDITLNWKKIFLASEKKQKSLYHSMIMARAYMDNIKNLSDDNNLYDFIYKSYPELENIRPLDLMSSLDVSDLFLWIN